MATFCHSNGHVYKQPLCALGSNGTTTCPRCALPGVVAIEPTTSMAYEKENGSLQKTVDRQTDSFGSK